MDLDSRRTVDTASTMITSTDPRLPKPDDQVPARP